MRKVLAVCGDSFMSAVSADEYGADSHFTQLLAKKLDWDYVTFARGGCGNSVIRLQIDEAIKIKPDLVIIGTTTADRLEFPIFPILRRTEENFWDGVYIKNHGLSNISWTPCDFSNNLELFNGRTPTLEAQTISNMINHPDYYVNGLMRCWYSSDYIKNLIKFFRKYEDSPKPPQKNALLEFLEGCLRRVVDTLSWKGVENIRSPPRNTDSDDI